MDISIITSIAAEFSGGIAAKSFAAAKMNFSEASARLSLEDTVSFTRRYWLMYLHMYVHNNK